MHRSIPLAAAAALVAANALLAQSNVVAGLDLALENTWNLQSFRRTGSGTFPTGVGAFGAWTTCCNPGSVAVQFQASMDPRHAFIHYMVARESNGRFLEISNRGYVKHTFGSSNDPSTCGSCAGTGRFSFVEIGCSDTYASSQAVDHFNLGPPDEVDPWLGTWVPQCSYFDMSDPPVAVSQQCDSLRSLTQTRANSLNATIHNQMLVRDAELNQAGTFYYQSAYLAPGELDANRDNNMGSRQFTPVWNGTNWTINDGPTFLQGSILQRWSGASVSSASNGVADGRFYVAVKVTGPVDGVYHYEYAVQNRDNKRGLGAFRLPICPEAVVTGFGFHDIDQDPLNNWTGSKVGSEIVFSTANNPQRWNSIFNFWFDTDAGPVAGSSLSLDQFDIGAGANTVLVTSTAPGGLYNENLGPGCGSPTAPTFFVAGSPARATLPNNSFELRSKDNPGFALCVFAYSNVVGTTNVGSGCTVYTGDLGTLSLLAFTVSDGNGLASFLQPIPNTPSFEGQTLDMQAANVATSGAWLGQFNLSNGLRIRLGNSITGCP